jgi:hypothetical protein
MKNSETKKVSRINLQPYIEYLLEDIQKAEGKESINTIPSVDEDDLMDHFAEMERWVREVPLQTFGEISGLAREQFPPSEQLSTKQIKKINKAIHQLLSTWNLRASIPRVMPPDREYKLLVGILNEKTHILKSGMAVFDFCTGCPEGCELEEYCSCREIWESRDRNQKNSGKKKSRSL